ncbi:PEP-utilizing enzyme [Vibrio alginolyticus]
MNVFILGAGAPISGSKPSALKNISSNTRAMDWQLHSFKNLTSLDNVYYLGGYHIEDVINQYPELNFILMPDWQSSSPLDTFLSAPLSGKACTITYGDTLFRSDFISNFISSDADVTVVVDSHWLARYYSRKKEDIDKAEVLSIDSELLEFTGLVHFGDKAVELIENSDRNVKHKLAGKKLLDLIDFMRISGLSISYKDVKGEWAEFNSPQDIAHFVLGTKADTLSRLESILKASYIGEQHSFNAQEWHLESHKVLDDIRAKFANKKLVVRSSSNAEDNWCSSNAGGFDSILNVDCNDATQLSSAIKTVVDSYGPSLSVSEEQVLVQEFLQDVEMSGVVFTCTLESGAPYYRFNFDDKTHSTESVTSGCSSDLRTVIVYKYQSSVINSVAPELAPVLKAVQELELLLGYDKLDIEFAVDSQGKVHLFQVRPMLVNRESYETEQDRISQSLKSNIIKYRERQATPPFAFGDNALFANMPDWNPAEIISTRPKPLSLSLYQQLITNEVWAKQRAQFGYKDVRPHPLVVSFSGHPYVDVRASFSSFIPESVPKDSAVRIVNAYLDILNNNPGLHDKIEFDVAFTIWTPEFKQQAISRLLPHGVLESDIDFLESGLKAITKKALHRLDDDISSIGQLTTRRQSIKDSFISDLDKSYMLLDDCKNYGTLAFSHAARAGFVAKTLLNSLVQSNGLSKERRAHFMCSFDTVAGQFEKDKARFSSGEITLGELIDQYGHLRPGTYEITTPAYWELPEHYLIPKETKQIESQILGMEFTDDELLAMDSLLEQIDPDLTTSAFIEYVIRATQERERVKFEFTKSLSKALDHLAKWGNTIGLTRDEVSYLSYTEIESIQLNRLTPDDLPEIIEKRKADYQITKAIELPSLISDASIFYGFEQHSSLPNYIGLNRVIAEVASISNENTNLRGKIVMIPQADPGYDWLFGHDIAGLITQFGGANSHMAIRSAEVGLPAAIGVGEKLYESLLVANKLELDCLGQRLRVLK